MEKIYTAADLTEAYLIKHRLEAAHIQVRVFNENAQGATGELPVTLPELWICEARDIERARVVITEFENRPVVSGKINCRRCEEENPSNFEICWHCGQQLPER